MHCCMPFVMAMIILTFGTLSTVVTSAHIGFYCNNGLYSHDLYSDHLAESVASRKRDNVSLIQIRIFKFKKQVSFRQRYISYDYTHDPQVIEAQKSVLALFWNVLVPFDNYNISGSLDAIPTMGKLHYSSFRGCSAALGNRTFIKQIKNLKLDLMIIDHSSDCGSGLANMLNIPFAHIGSSSNAIDYMEFPSNPSYVPLYFCNFEPYENFWQRFLNTFGYSILIYFRYPFSNQGYQELFYKKLKVQIARADSFEWKPLMSATPWELFLDMPRPVARNVRYFGCEYCSLSENKQEKVAFSRKTAGIILVSFGTLIEPKKIPVQKLQSFVKAFAYFPHHTFIWQLDISLKYFQNKILRPLNVTMPKNIMLHRWVPMRDLLKDPEVVLLITHGGATTCLEAAYSGVPMLGVSIQSDQHYNTQRLSHRGLGDAIIVTEVEADTVLEKMQMIFLNYKMHKSRVIKFRQMLMEYRAFENQSSAFWISFMARQFGGRASDRKLKLQRYWMLRQPSNWLIYCGCDIFAFSIVAYFLASISIG